MNPTDTQYRKQLEVASAGLTKRELFAAMAMAGALSEKFLGQTSTAAPELPKWFFRNCVQAADALIAELESIVVAGDSK
jgi:hypothetical protein